jgi:hypothetical protein
MTEPHEHPLEPGIEEPLDGSLEVSANGAGEAPAPAGRGRRSWRKHALGGAVIVAVLVGGGLRLVPSGQAAPDTGQGAAASTACSAS